MDPSVPDDKARPRDREAEEGEAPVEPGFTTTGPDGSAGGRSLYGMADEETHKPTDVDALTGEERE